MYNLAVFVSGRGSNLKAILTAISNGNLCAEVKVVISDKPDCYAIEMAKEYKIPCYFVSKLVKPGFVGYEQLKEILIQINTDLIVLAGFLKKIPDDVVEYFHNKIINIHPALLPSFGGAGMYGIKVHQAVFYSSAKVSGATVHFVDPVYDNGKIIAQRAIDITDVQSPEEIAERVLKVEHELLPFVIGKIEEGKIQIKDNRVFITN